MYRGEMLPPFEHKVSLQNEAILALEVLAR